MGFARLNRWHHDGINGFTPNWMAWATIHVKKGELKSESFRKYVISEKGQEGVGNRIRKLTKFRTKLRLPDFCIRQHEKTIR